MSRNNLLFYGRPYHLVFDRLNTPMRQQVLQRVPEGARVVDIACGTGELMVLRN